MNRLSACFGPLVLAGVLLSVLAGCGTGVPSRVMVSSVPRAAGAPVSTGLRPAEPTESAVSQARLLQGPVIGAVDSHQAHVWVRTSIPANVVLQYGRAPDLSDAVTTPVTQTFASRDATIQIPLGDLAPATQYYVNVVVGGVSQLLSPYPTFKTFPVPGAPAAFRFVILNDFFWKPSTTFRQADRTLPDFIVIGGDLSHSNPDTVQRKRAMFLNRYNPDGKSSDFVRFILRRYAVAHFWDDHDYGLNNGDRTYPRKTLSLQVLKDYFPTYPMTQFGDWQSFTYGDADFFMLDTRSQRDPDTMPDGPAKSMLDGDHLGAQGQYEWLTQGLVHSTATWKFVFTPVVFNPTVPKPDAWRGYQNERAQLVSFLREHGVRNVILLSGDLHAGGMDSGKESGFPEMLVPPPNGNHCLTAPRPGTWDLGVYMRPAYEPCLGFGLVTVETNPPRVELQVRNERGETMLTQTIVAQ